MKSITLGTSGPTIGRLGLGLMGMLGGDAGAAADAAASLDFGTIIQSVIGGGAGGAVLTAIIGMIKKALVK